MVNSSWLSASLTPWGLARADTVASVDELDAYTDARAAKTLFAVPQNSPQSGQALRVGDPDDLLMRLVLFPDFEVN